MPQSQQQTFSSSLLNPPANQAASIFSSYKPNGACFDELVSQDCELRPSWQKFKQLVDRLGAEEFSRRWDHSQRLIYENGIAYSPYGDPEASGRLWELDALPLLITAQEWNTVATGVTQRATVLQNVLHDLLGPQRLIKEGVLPAAILFDHKGFRLPFHGLVSAEDSILQFYASDLGRSADGRWWLLADRTEAPSGIGFALENRIVLSRMLPDIFRKCNVHRLAPFFMSFQSALQQLSRTAHKSPRIVLFSRGPQDETYFEDAYLARYLGYALVEGADLAVRENRVWMKTLDGLLPIDVLLRRPNSEACDPLEFSNDKSLGVAGLLNAARSENVAIANPIGSGLVESPIFMAFMPRLCKFFLKEELMLPGIATWWCGDPKSLQHVLANFENLVIGPAFRLRGQSKAIRESLRCLTKDELRSRIQEHPGQYIAQEQLDSSSVAVWKQGQLVPEKLVLRAFASANNGTYEVMDGGLARTSSTLNPADGVVPTGQGSKDTWIIGEEAVEPVTLLSRHEESIVLRRVGSDLPSRVADNIYWLGRQIERADSSARLLRTVVLQMTSETAGGITTALPPLLRALAEQGQIEPGYAVEDIKKPLPDIEMSLPQLVFDRQQPGTLRSVFDHVFRLASQVRDRLSIDTWRIFVRMDQRFRMPQFEPSVDLTDVLTLVNTLIVDLAAIEGMVMESMTRSHVFRFLDLGRRLERALQTVGLVRSCFVGSQAVSAELLEAVLEIADSLMTYRSRYLSNLQLAAVLDLLLTDETNPRSIAYQLMTLQKHVDQLPQDSQAGHPEHERQIMSLVHLIRMVDVQEISDMHRLGEHDVLEKLFDTLARDLPKLSNKISQRYLVHAGPARTMSSVPLAP